MSNGSSIHGGHNGLVAVTELLALLSCLHTDQSLEHTKLVSTVQGCKACPHTLKLQYRPLCMDLHKRRRAVEVFARPNPQWSFDGTNHSPRALRLPGSTEQRNRSCAQPAPQPCRACRSNLAVLPCAHASIARSLVGRLMLLSRPQPVSLRPLHLSATATILGTTTDLPAAVTTSSLTRRNPPSIVLPMPAGLVSVLP